MSIIWVRARCSCDECGKVFTVEVDPAAKVGPDVAEAVDDALRGGELVDGSGMCSLYDGVQRCGDCRASYVSAYIKANPDRISCCEPAAAGWVRVETYDGRQFRLPLMALQGVPDVMEMRVCPFRGFAP